MWLRGWFSQGADQCMEGWGVVRGRGRAVSQNQFWEGHWKGPKHEGHLGLSRLRQTTECKNSQHANLILCSSCLSFWYSCVSCVSQLLSLRSIVKLGYNKILTYLYDFCGHSVTLWYWFFWWNTYSQETHGGLPHTEDGTLCKSVIVRSFMLCNIVSRLFNVSLVGIEPGLEDNDHSFQLCKLDRFKKIVICIHSIKINFV